MRTKNIFFIIFFSIIIISCEENKSSKSSKSSYDINPNTSDDLFDKYLDLRKEIYSKMKYVYYWTKEIPSYIGYNYNSNPVTLFESLLYKRGEYDRFSYITDQYTVLDNALKGVSQKYFGIVFVQINDEFYVKNVTKNSDAEKKGIRRGYKIVKINNEVPTLSLVNGLSNFNDITINFLINGSISKDISISRTEFNTASFYMDTVFKNISNSGKNIGYLVFDNFVSTTDFQKEVVRIFNKFNAENVDELIVDLRYNGGGLVDYALNFISHLIPSIYENDYVIKLEFNTEVNKELSINERYYKLKKIENSNKLILDKITFLTTKNTASASELAINSLKPYMTVKLVGNKTYGKPVGSNRFELINNWGILPITFAYFNSKDQGDFFSGINVDYEIEDDPRIDFADMNEPLLKEALNKVYGIGLTAISTDNKFKYLKKIKEITTIKSDFNLPNILFLK